MQPRRAVSHGDADRRVRPFGTDGQSDAMDGLRVPCMETPFVLRAQRLGVEPVPRATPRRVERKRIERQFHTAPPCLHEGFFQGPYLDEARHALRWLRRQDVLRFRCGEEPRRHRFHVARLRIGFDVDAQSTPRSDRASDESCGIGQVEFEKIAGFSAGDARFAVNVGGEPPRGRRAVHELRKHDPAKRPGHQELGPDVLARQPVESLAFAVVQQGHVAVNQPPVQALVDPDQVDMDFVTTKRRRHRSSGFR
ncbi:hypothetical protein KCV01_g14215, partial [Aureobasidium melanogenum]